MDVSCKATCILIEAAEAAGIPRAELARGCAVGVDHLTDARRRIEWRVFAELHDRLSTLVGDDPDRLRAVGSHIVRAPSYEFLQKLARRVVSLRALYLAGNAWMAPALFPNVKVSTEFLSDRLVRVYAELAPGYRDSEAFFYVSQGSVTDLPRLMGAPCATLVRSEVDGRHALTDLLLPPREPFFARSRRAVSARLHARDGAELVKAQQKAIQTGLEAIAAATEEFRTVLERLPDPVLIQRQGKILWANRALATVLAYDAPAELVGTTLMDIVHEPFHALLAERMNAPTGDSSLPKLTEVVLKKTDGTFATIEVAPAERVSFGGAAARLVSGRDITERVRIQQRLVTADRLASMGLLAAGVAHEINNPLAYVLNSIENATRAIGREHPVNEQATEALATALEGVLRMRSIVQDLVNLSRVPHGDLQAVDVESTLEATLALASHKIGERARVVRMYKPCPAARANPARLGQVFLNLIVNAVDAMPLLTSNDELRVRTGTDSLGRAVIEISDTGVGMSRDLLGRIFDPFFTTKADGKGTGLGLSISHGIVAELGGEITVASVVGEGSTFRVVLPAAEMPS